MLTLDRIRVRMFRKAFDMGMNVEIGWLRFFLEPDEVVD